MPCQNMPCQASAEFHCPKSGAAPPGPPDSLFEVGETFMHPRRWVSLLAWCKLYSISCQKQMHVISCQKQMHVISCRMSAPDPANSQLCQVEINITALTQTRPAMCSQCPGAQVGALGSSWAICSDFIIFIIIYHFKCYST